MGVKGRLVPVKCLAGVKWVEELGNRCVILTVNKIDIRDITFMFTFFGKYCVHLFFHSHTYKS